MPPLKPGQPTDDVPHDVDFNPPEATELAPGVTLRTKDSKATGNAIVVKETVPSRMAQIGLAQTDTKYRFWVVETDFGNRMTLCDQEIEEMFELGLQQDYERWWNARMDLIAKTI